MGRLFALFLVLAGAAPIPALGQPAVAGAGTQMLSYESLPGWRDDDHAAALKAFLKTCPVLSSRMEATGSPRAVPRGLDEACSEAATVPDHDRDLARAFFERRFSAFEVVPPAGRGFLTGYYEPEFAGSLHPTEDFPTPLLARPDDLVTFEPGETRPDLLAGLTAARRTASGLEPYPDRGAIEDGAIAERTRPVAFVRDAVDAFIIQVQGSARLKLPDGGVIRVAFDGKNGHPYTSVARLLVERLGIPPAEMTADVLTAWLRANPVEARELLRQNRSFVFFRVAGELDPSDGPIGAAGVPVTAGRTLAVDRDVWSMGLPVWLESELPDGSGGSVPLRRLTIAQDTGSAIKGPARGDLFFGAGHEAGSRAGLLRGAVRFVVLWPKTDREAAGAP